MGERHNAMTAPSISWSEFIVLFCTCGLTGAVLGPVLWVLLHGAPWFYLPLALPLGAAIASVLAVPAAVLASVCLLLARQYLRPKRPASWLLLGSAAGAVVGTVHPVVLLILATSEATGSPAMSVLPEGAMLIGVPGLVAGAIIGVLESRKQPSAPEGAIGVV